VFRLINFDKMYPWKEKSTKINGMDIFWKLTRIVFRLINLNELSVKKNWKKKHGYREKKKLKKIHEYYLKIN